LASSKQPSVFTPDRRSTISVIDTDTALLRAAHVVREPAQDLRSDRPQVARMLRVYCRDAKLFVGNAAAGLL
jgi:hypothetical protein